MKKIIAIGLLALLALGTFVGAALAATKTTNPWDNLTDKQKAELGELQRQMLSIREKLIDKYVEYKWITPEQAQYLKDRLALKKKYAGQFGWGMFGFGRRGGWGCGGPGGGRMMGGWGMMGGFGPGFPPAPNANT